MLAVECPTPVSEELTTSNPNLKWIFVVLTSLTIACSPQQDQSSNTRDNQQETAIVDLVEVNDQRLINAGREPEQWLAYGQTFEEQRFSQLTQINRETISNLGLAWYRPFGERHRLQGTPLVVDGVMFVSNSWNVTYALDAASGKELWRFDPEVDRTSVRYACCGGPMSRGVAVYQNKVLIATFDGRMVAVDASNGNKLWDVDTYHPSAVSPFTISGAPRVGGGKVYIGQSSSEFGVRGYVSAFDVETGDLAWRFYLVPGDPAQAFEHPELEPAAKTWSGEWWKLGGGGTVWNSIVYDPDFHTVYLGVGNGAPWPRSIRSPGGGDNLYLASIVAVDPDTGKMKWYYQTTPGDNWDYTATQDMVLADLEIEGQNRKVLLQAPKNGFFYVLDRSDGKLLNAHPYGRITWASHVDMDTGRPVENPDEYYDENPRWIWPGTGGAHNWQAMSFDASKGVMFIPTLEIPTFFALPEEVTKTGIFKKSEIGMDLGLAQGAYRERLIAESEQPAPNNKAFLKAFHPLTGKTLWNVEKKNSYNGGVLATAGGLVFQGDGSWTGESAGNISAYDSDTGSLLWEFEAFASMGAPPISYEIDGTQYLAILGSVNQNYEGSGKLMVFRLGGDENLPIPKLRDNSFPVPPALSASEETLIRGDQLYHEVCANCHGALGRDIIATRVKDLRRMTSSTHTAFQSIVLDGVLEKLGMRSFSDVLNAKDAEAIRQFVISKAIVAYEEQENAEIPRG